MAAHCSRKLARLAAAAIAGLAAGHAAGQTLETPGAMVETVVAGLELPTAMQFLAPDDFLVCEKASGRIWRVVSGEKTGVVLDLPVASQATRGLLGLALHPRFDENGWTYVFYSLSLADGGAWIENRVSRFTFDGARLDPASETIIAQFQSDAAQNNTPACEGGVMRFGPDGLLYGCIGDLGRGGFENPRVEQNSGNGAAADAGGIFRLRDDGGVPADNPFAAHADPLLRRLYAYGVRNTYGLDFDPLTGALWTTENGPEVYDEINRLRSGANSGWLKIMGPDARDARFEKNGHTPFDADELVLLAGASYVDPQLSFLNPLGLTALRFVDGAQTPCAWRGRILAGDTNTGRLYLLTLSADRMTLDLPETLSDGVADDDTELSPLVAGHDWGVTTDIQLDGSGAIYVVSLTDGAVRRIRAPELAGDLNGDSVVDLADLQRLLVSFRLNAGGDADCDGDTDLADLSLLLEQFASP